MYTKVLYFVGPAQVRSIDAELLPRIFPAVREQDSYTFGHVLNHVPAISPVRAGTVVVGGLDQCDVTTSQRHIFVLSLSLPPFKLEGNETI